MQSGLIEPSAATEPWALRDLPPFPWITTKVLQLFAAPSESVDAKRLSELIRADASLTSELLRRANSALYGLRSQIATVERAVTMLGLDQVKGLAMTVGVSSYLKVPLKLAILRKCWRHSLGCALIAEELAPAIKVRPDQAYTAGLLHDVGRLGLLVKYPQSYADLLNVCIENQFDLLSSERDLFDIDHCEAGAWLAEGWEFPAELVQVIADHHHHTPEAAEPLLRTVHLACRLADVIGFEVVEAKEVESVAAIAEELPNRTMHLMDDDGAELRSRLAQKVNALE
jgi:putative nucleotidyltransferase with HDIG domain